MTWREFKQQAEAAGITDEMEIWYIDISFPNEVLNIYPDDGSDKRPGLSIWC